MPPFSIYQPRCWIIPYQRLKAIILLLLSILFSLEYISKVPMLNTANRQIINTNSILHNNVGNCISHQSFNHKP